MAALTTCCITRFRRFGIETTFVKPGDLDAWRAAVQPNTKLFFGETVGNPGMDVLDLPAVSQIAHAAGVPLLVDATLTSPWLLKPLEHGADLVVHSATKFLSGHGTVIGGLVVDGGSFDWDGPNTNGKFAELTQAYEGFHNMVFTKRAPLAHSYLRARREGLRDFGACMSPHTAWLILQGIETLPLRMARHVSNTEKVVNFLATHPMVSRVGHPMLESHPSHALAQKLLPEGLALCSVSTLLARVNKAKPSLKPCKCSAIWPMWAIAVLWSSTPPAPPISGLTTKL
jgi:O-acetylhomoserine (thiol)-lyase